METVVTHSAETTLTEDKHTQEDTNANEKIDCLHLPRGVANLTQTSVDPYSPVADESPGLNRTWLDHVDGSPTPNKPPPVFKPASTPQHDTDPPVPLNAENKHTIRIKQSYDTVVFFLNTLIQTTTFKPHF